MTINLLNKDNTHSTTESNFVSNSHSDMQIEPSVTLFPETKAAETLRPEFWSRFTLNELNHSEWRPCAMAAAVAA